MHLALKNPALSEEEIKYVFKAKARVVPEINIVPIPELEAMVIKPEKRKRIQFIDLRRK